MDKFLRIFFTFLFSICLYIGSVDTNRAHADVARSLQQTADKDGYVKVLEAWAYASATTITVPTGAVSRYQPGDKLKLNNTTTKYFYITIVADTLLTVTGGTDYTVANLAISEIKVSRQSPPDFPAAFNWSPTLTGFSANPTNTVYQFYISDGWCYVHVRQATNGTSNATTFWISAPVTPTTLSNAIWGNAWIEAVDNGSLIAAPGKAYASSANSVIVVGSTMSSDNWTAANGKRASFNLAYRIR